LNQRSISEIIGKLSSGKPTWFDEGELEIELTATKPVLYSTVVSNISALLAPSLMLRSPTECLARYDSST
jgi:hypothetical protein